jgi:hypothetical protein
LNDHELAKKIGSEGKKTATARFGITRFIREWEALFEEVTRNRTHSNFLSDRKRQPENIEPIKEST